MVDIKLVPAKHQPIAVWSQCFWGHLTSSDAVWVRPNGWTVLSIRSLVYVLFCGCVWPACEFKSPNYKRATISTTKVRLQICSTSFRLIFVSPTTMRSEFPTDPITSIMKRMIKGVCCNVWHVLAGLWHTFPSHIGLDPCTQLQVSHNHPQNTCKLCHIPQSAALPFTVLHARSTLSKHLVYSTGCIAWSWSALASGRLSDLNSWLVVCLHFTNWTYFKYGRCCSLSSGPTCKLFWEDSNLLYIGWSNAVKVRATISLTSWQSNCSGSVFAAQWCRTFPPKRGTDEGVVLLLSLRWTQHANSQARHGFNAWAHVWHCHLLLSLLCQTW